MTRTYGLIAAAIATGLSLVTAAWAADWSNLYAIGTLETRPSEGVYRIYPNGGITDRDNRADCPSADYFEVSASTSANQEAAERFNKTLLSAMLSGRKIRVYVAGGGCGPTNRPVFSRIRVYGDF